MLSIEKFTPVPDPSFSDSGRNIFVHDIHMVERVLITFKMPDSASADPEQPDILRHTQGL